jgi:hypothetical protein
MALNFAVCKVCGESHVLQRSGAMSIHYDKSGERCAGSVTPTTVDRPHDPTRLKAERKQATKDRAARDTASPVSRDEREAAYDAARKGRRGRDRDEPTPERPFDRRIYVTSRATFVRGGLPGGGARR